MKSNSRSTRDNSRDITWASVLKPVTTLAMYVLWLTVTVLLFTAADVWHLRVLHSYRLDETFVQHWISNLMRIVSYL